jgi:hypothetical protein
MGRIIAVAGLIGSGKDTISDYLCTFHGFKRLSFASSLKDAVSLVFGWDRGMLEGSTKSSREWREQVDPWWSERLNMPNLTPRWVLQQWGTDVLRNHFHDSLWIASLENKLRTAQDDIVITDCRFRNELAAVKQVGGITIRVNRGPNPPWYDIALEYNNGDLSKVLTLYNLGVHASEYSSVGLDYDHQIDNNGDLLQLYDKINQVLE